MSELVKLGRTELQVSRVCFGCWQMGGTYWGVPNEENLIGAVRRAFDVGVNFFDTADAYGDGFAEELLGRALKGISRDKFVLATKVYHHWLGERGSKRVGDLSYEYIIWECEQSLKRLGLDYIDLYQAHSYDNLTPLEETVRAFDKLKKDGKIRYYGCSNFSVEQLRAACIVGDFDTIQPRYNLLDRKIESDILPFCLSHNIGVLVYSPLNLGLLTGKFTGDEAFEDLRGKHPDFQGERFKENVEKVNQLRTIADRHNKTITQVSLRALLEHPAVHCTIVGIKKAEQIEEAAGAMSFRLSREDYYDIRAIFQ